MSGRVERAYSTAWADHFWRRVSRTEDNQCWLWKLALTGGGRASFGIGGRKALRRINASRFSYWLANGSIPDGMVVCHRCDTPACVNPGHLFAGTQADNLADMTVKGRRARCGQPGESNWNAKISNADAARIAARFALGESAADLARAYSINRTSVYRMCKRAAR